MKIQDVRYLILKMFPSFAGRYGHEGPRRKKAPAPLYRGHCRVAMRGAVPWEGNGGSRGAAEVTPGDTSAALPGAFSRAVGRPFYAAWSWGPGNDFHHHNMSEHVRTKESEFSVRFNLHHTTLDLNKF